MEMVKIRLLSEDAKIPEYKTAEAAGADLYSAEHAVIAPGERKLIGCGIAIELSPGWEAQVRPRSGLALSAGITVLNTPATIDSDYRGELKVILYNAGGDDFSVNKGDRIAQLVISPVMQAQFVLVSQLNDTKRGDGGFGSTGV